MTAALVALLVAAQVQAPATPARPIGGVVVDAATGAPVAGARVQAGSRGAPATTDALGRFVLQAETGDTLRVRRIGYRAATLVMAATDDSAVVLLAPVATPIAERTVLDERAREHTARLQANVSVTELRSTGVASAAAAVARLPFVSARGTHGDVRVSMRGSRSEQVLVTLDGAPLNDPAVGSADLSDVPLAALGALAVLPGADPVRGGPGASGGTIALTSGDGSVVSATGGSFGRFGLEGATRVPVAGGTMRVGAALHGARNDFRFLNTAGASITPDTIERRVNNDERRGALFASAVLPRVQLLALASATERGLVGGMNVRAYDRDRGRTARLLLRAAGEAGGTALSASVRALRNAYRDPLHPESDATARSLSADVGASRAAGPLVVRSGVGADRFAADGISPIPAVTRARAFAAVDGEARRGPLRATAGLRADAIERAGARPSASAALEAAVREGGVLFVRAAQAFRAPTLYDLYFASPLRLVATTLPPERVVLDAEAGARLTSGRVRAEGSLFERRTRDAIVWFPGNFVFSPQSVARERVRGAEGRAELHGSWMTAAAWAGVYHARLAAEPYELPTPYAPYASGGGTLSIRRGPAALTSTLRAFGRRPFRTAPVARRNELPGVAIVDAAVSWETRAGRSRLLVTAGVENAGGVRWESVRSYPSPGRSWTAGVTIEPR